MKKCLITFRRFFPFLTVAFIGGFLSFIFLCWLNKPVNIQTPDTAVSIANTYIVFTTIIFVAFTIVITIVSYVFSQQFSESKELQVKHLLNEIEEELKTNNNDIGIKIIDKALANPDVQIHLENKFNEKLSQLLEQKSTQLLDMEKKVNHDAEKIKEMSNFIKDPKKV